MVPTEMLIIPWFSGIHQLKLGNTYPGLIFPGLISAFGVFILRQAILNIPDEYIEAARIDGMSEPGIFFRIILPLISGPLTALALITALNVWNDFLWPLIVVNNKAMYTIQVGIAYAADATATDLGTDWSIVMSATTIASVPMLLLVIAAQKYFVKGISLSGLKR
jgi:multiple sugar transport system permease protein